jgi:predicted transcriptional regulator
MNAFYPATHAPDDFAQTLSALESSLLVRAIMSFPLTTVMADSCPVRFFADPRNAEFDCAPVTANAQIIGMVYRANLKSHAIDSCRASDTDVMTPLHRVPMVASTDTVSGLILRMQETDHHHWLVLDGMSFSAIVTRSDLWKLPVRMLLICRLLRLEQLLATAMRRLGPNDSWLNSLSPGRQSKIRETHRSLMRRNEQVDVAESTHFSEKVTAVQKLRRSFSDLPLGEVTELRDLLMHARDGQSDQEAVSRLLKRVAQVDECLAELAAFCAGDNCTPDMRVMTTR